MRFAVLLLAAFAFVRPTAAAAQGGPNRCGDTTLAQDDLEDLAHYFTDDEDADFREGLIDKVPADAPQEVVRDPRVCNSLYHKMIEQLRTNTNWRELQRGGFRHRMLRIGPYYAVLVDAISPPGQKVFGWTDMMIFRASDLAFLGGGLV
jgi:hypothetical protein